MLAQRWDGYRCASMHPLQSVPPHCQPQDLYRTPPSRATSHSLQLHPSIIRPLNAGTVTDYTAAAYKCNMMRSHNQASHWHTECQWRDSFPRLHTAAGCALWAGTKLSLRKLSPLWPEGLGLARRLAGEGSWSGWGGVGQACAKPAIGGPSGLEWQQQVSVE